MEQPQGPTRRQLLQDLACGAGALALPGSLRAAAGLGPQLPPIDPLAAKRPMFPARVKRVICLFMQGGPSHVDSFDYKPELIRRDGAAIDFTGVRFGTFGKASKRRLMRPLWRFAQHGDCGRWVSELFPYQAGIVDELCFIHSMHTDGVALRRGLADTGIHASMQACEWLHEGRHPRLASAVLERCRGHLDALVDPSRYQAELERLGQLPDVEPDDSSIAALCAQPASTEQLQGIASRWRQMGFAERADATLADAARQFPNDIDLYEARCVQAIRSRDAETLESLVAHPPEHPEGMDNARFYEGVFAQQSGDDARAIAAFEWVWARRQDWAEVPKRLGRLQLQHDPARSLEVWQQAADAFEAPLFGWLAMVAATIAEDWPSQARLAETLELPELPSDRRADQSWGYLRIRLPSQPEPLLAERTGPVTARILSLRPPDAVQHHGEIVVFNPEYNNADEVADDEDALRIHDAWAGLEPANKACVALDGIWPGEQAMQALSDALEEARIWHQAAAGEGYQITDPDTGETHRGLYRFLAVDDASAASLREILDAHRPDHGPWVYHELLDRLGEATEAEAQRVAARAWGLI